MIDIFLDEIGKIGGYLERWKPSSINFPDPVRPAMKPDTRLADLGKKIEALKAMKMRGV